jgi:hypothetical protein
MSIIPLLLMTRDHYQDETLGVFAVTSRLPCQLTARGVYAAERKTFAQRANCARNEVD